MLSAGPPVDPDEAPTQFCVGASFLLPPRGVGGIPRAKEFRAGPRLPATDPPVRIPLLRRRSAVTSPTPESSAAGERPDPELAAAFDAVAADVVAGQLDRARDVLLRLWAAEVSLVGAGHDRERGSLTMTFADGTVLTAALEEAHTDAAAATSALARWGGAQLRTVLPRRDRPGLVVAFASPLGTAYLPLAAVVA